MGFKNAEPSEVSVTDSDDPLRTALTSEVEHRTRQELAGDVLDCLLEGCQVIGSDWTYIYVNAAAAAQGRRSGDELAGRTMMECYPGIEQTPMFETLRRCMRDRQPLSMQNEFTFPDGSSGWFELRFEPVPRGVCILSLDITEERRSQAALARSEEQLRHAQKMEAVGRLAGGVAHDFNNILSVVLSYAEMIAGGLKPTDPLWADVEEIRKAARRATELTKQLLAFSRRQQLDAKVLNLNQSVLGMENMLRRLLGADIDLTLLPGRGLGNIKADPGYVEQIVMNLAVNARDAMPGGGKLTIETTNVELDQDYAATHHEVSPGHYVQLAVTDSGIGMDSATQARIFEPFFTTKGQGKGTGLGLAMVFGIVKQSGGHIWVYSEPGRGTTFKLYFPTQSAPVELRPSEPPIPDSGRGNETILLVEDDEQVRALASGILRRKGYVVFDAPNGGEALLICETHGAKIDLLLTDVVLPRMTGRQLAERLKPLHPEMRVLFMSGYADDAVLQHGLVDSGVAYLEKPITPASLTRKVREAVRARRGR